MKEKTSTVSTVKARRDIGQALGASQTNEDIVAARPSLARQTLHDQMAQETADFVANGGVIEQIPMGVSGYVHDPFKAKRATNGVGRSMQSVPSGRGATAASKAARAKVISMAAKRAEARRRKASPASAGYDS